MKKKNELLSISNRAYGLLYKIAIKHDCGMKNINKLYLIIICIADAIVAAIIIINPIYGLSASSRPRQPSSNRWAKINLKHDNFFNVNFSDKLLCFLKSASAKLCQV